MTTARAFSSDPAEFAGKRVLVTGGTKGAGAAIVRRLASAGAIVATAARSEPPESLLPTLFVAADLGTVAGTGALAAAVMKELAGIDILVHCLGGSRTPGGGFG